MMDLIDRAKLLQHLDEEIRTAPNSIALNEAVEIRGYVNRMPRVDSGIEWHKVTKRPLTEEEKSYYEELDPDIDVEEIFDCEMPVNGQEILVATSWGVDKDTCDYDYYGTGLEYRGDWDDVYAWAELPKYEED